MPVISSDQVELPRKPKKPPVTEVSAPATNGTNAVMLGSKRKRSADEASDTAEQDQQLRKRGKVDEESTARTVPSATGVISLDDDEDGVVESGGGSVPDTGAITIDDD
jgi:hypothetical protein